MTLGAEANWRIRQWFPEIDERAQERLRIYHLELLRWTKTINLISASSVFDSDNIHFADSIIGANLVLKDVGDTKELWDLGSGNGFPGVVFCILRPSLGVICVESDDRKASFLKQLALRLELDSLGVRRERVEKLPAEAIGVAVARGFASIQTALDLTPKQFPKKGVFYHFKGADWLKEIGEIKGKVPGNWESQLLKEYRLNPEKDPAKDNLSPARAIIKSVRKG